MSVGTSLPISRRKYSGFTIVELLIVVVVIAILATITIVAYNGIQNQAKQAAVKSAVAQASRALGQYAVENGDTYPTPANLQSSTNLDASTYTYMTNSDATDYCISATDSQNQSITAAYTSAGQAMVDGRCAANLVANPTFAVDASGWTLNAAGGVNGVLIPVIPEGYTGNHSLRYNVFASSSINSFGPYRQVQGLNATSSYEITAWVRASKPVTYRIVAERRNSSNGLYSGSHGGITAGDYFQWDGVMMTEGATPYEYSQGGDTGWVANGDPSTTTAFGPVVEP